MEIRETYEVQIETVFRPRDERSPFICHLSFAFDSPVSPPPPPIVPRAEIVLSSRQDPERKIGEILVENPRAKIVGYAEAFRPV